MKIAFDARLEGAEPDELQRDSDAAGGYGLPDLAEPASAQQADQGIACDGLDTGIQMKPHGGHHFGLITH